MSQLEILDLIRIFLILALAYLAYIDLRTFRLPDAITIPLILAGLCFNSFSSLRFISPQESIFGGLVGFLLLWLLNRLYRYIKKQDGIGMGDAKLLSALGAWLGWATLPSILFLASISGIIGGMIWLRLNKQNHDSPFPFGPFLISVSYTHLTLPTIYSV